MKKDSLSAQLHGDYEDEHQHISLEGPSGEDAIPSAHHPEGELSNAEKNDKAVPDAPASEKPGSSLVDEREKSAGTTESTDVHSPTADEEIGEGTLAACPFMTRTE